MPQVKVKDKFQVTIPVEIRQRLDMHVGDLLEVEIQGNHIVLKPQMVMDRIKAFEKFQELLRDVHARNENVSDEELIEDVMGTIEEVRKEKQERA